MTASYRERLYWDWAAGHFVAEHLQQQIVMGHLLLARECQPLGQRVEHARQLQPPQDGS
jgi:hypothetical protein